MTDAITLGNLEVDFDRYLVRVEGEPIDLAYLQFRCLGLLLRRRDNVVSRDELSRELWGEPVFRGSMRLNLQISRLRQQLRDSSPWGIVTIHKRGYILTPRPFDYSGSPGHRRVGRRGAEARSGSPRV